jgi:hypothetical protein
MGMAFHTCNPSTWEAEAGGLWCEFEARLDYIVKPVSKNVFFLVCFFVRKHQTLPK